jgi:hypothetical protein
MPDPAKFRFNPISRTVAMRDNRYSPRRVTLRTGEVRTFRLDHTDEYFAVWTWNENNEAKPVALPQRFRMWGPDEWTDEQSCDLRAACDSARV